MQYLAVMGRQPKISLAELKALFSDVQQISPTLATFKADGNTDFSRLGGVLKVAIKLGQKPLDYLRSLPDGKLTIGLSDYSKNASPRAVKQELLKLKQILVRHGRSVRVVENKAAVLSTATSYHNGLSGKNPRKIELIKNGHDYYRVVSVQNIDAYARRDQARPARDAKVGMLPPKLAQILINLCGPLPEDSRILDPFCGTGVVLQEALLMGYQAYGTDIDERMVEYSVKNLEWLTKSQKSPYQVAQGDATSYAWQPPIDAVACECYLGAPMSQPPVDIKLKQEKEKCKTIIVGFLKNLSPQLQPNTPVVIAIPAWLRLGGKYERIWDFSSKKVDEIENLGYNVCNKSREGLLYYREGQVVARDIIILRK